MFNKEKVKSILTPDIYTQIYDDIRAWCYIELSNLSPVPVDGKQLNALLNFATFDVHTLMTEKGVIYITNLLTANNSTQTVMIRLKGLVEDLYIKYGTEIIDELRHRVYATQQNLYGITFDIESKIDVNNTYWLHPFIRRMYTELKQ